MSQPNENRLITSARYALCLLTTSGVLLGGCASSGVGSVAQTTRAEYYPFCCEPVSHLRNTGNAVRNSAVTGTITDDLLSDLASGLTSDESRGRNAALTAAGGALAGDTTDYHMRKQEQVSGDRACIGFYAIDIGHSTVGINRSVAYARLAQSYYQNQFRALLDGCRNKSISEAEGHKRLAEIVSGLQEANALLVAANGRASGNINNYTQTYEKDLQQVGVPHAEMTKVAEAENRASTMKGGSRPKIGNSPKVPKEAIAIGQATRKVQDAQSEGNKVAPRDQGMIQEVCSSPDMGDWTSPDYAKA